MWNRIRAKLRAEGIRGLLTAVAHRVYRPPLAVYRRHAPLIAGKIGLEIGGPSGIFRRGEGLLPIYAIAERIDNCTFGHQTMWEGKVEEGSTFKFDKRKRPGTQYIVEASRLGVIESGSRDFVASSHVLEHVANPLKALHEWIRVLRVGGLLILVLPHKDGAFDHRRPVTPLAHLVEDFERGVDEGDMTHLDEILSLHDLARDPAAGDFATFRARGLKNHENRGLHHHVFDTRLAVDLVDHMGLQVLGVEPCLPLHIVVIARKPDVAERVSNNRFRQVGHSRSAGWASPFPSDRPGSGLDARGP